MSKRFSSPTVFFKWLVNFIYVIKIRGTELFIIFVYYPCNVHDISSDTPSFILLLVIFIISLFMVTLTRGLSILLLFSKSQLLFYLQEPSLLNHHFQFQFDISFSFYYFWSLFGLGLLLLFFIFLMWKFKMILDVSYFQKYMQSVL